MAALITTSHLPERPSPVLSDAPPPPRMPGGIESVLDGGYCIGCGACSAISDSPCQMKLNPLGMFEASLQGEKPTRATIEKVDEVCPFSDRSENETQIGKRLFDDGTTQWHDALGFHRSCYGAHVEEGTYRTNGSSGGMGSWIQCMLLEEGLVDFVINVKPAPRENSDQLLFQYTVCSNSDEIRQSSKSRYYPIEMSRVLEIVRNRPGRYALVGLPCFLKSARLLCRQDPLMNKRLKFFVGLVCGHLKSKRFAEYLSWQVGVPPRSLESFDFRKKLPGKPADQYGIEVTGTIDGSRVTKSKEVSQLDGCDWGRGYFKYKACDFCDDVLAETADVVIGDAWLPQFSEDWQGTNVVVTRHPLIEKLIHKGEHEGRLNLVPLSADDVAQSQNAGLRHRREGLRYRLSQASKRNEWHPAKRVLPGKDHLNAWDQSRHSLREEMREGSHRSFAEALADNQLSVFQDRMDPLAKRHESLMKPRRSGFLIRALRLLFKDRRNS